MILNVSRRLSNENNKNYVYQTLKTNIMELILSPGQAINETDVGRELSVSRTPVRESFIRLSEEHLITTYSQRGSYVSKIDMRLVEEGTFMRRCLEKAVYSDLAAHCPPEVIQELRKMLAVQKAVVQSQTDYASEFIHLDNQFHAFLFETAGKSNVWNSIISINTHFNRLRFLDLKEKTNIYKVLFQHEMLIDALEQQQPEDVVRVTEEHQENVMGILEKIHEKYSEFFL